MAQLNDSVVNGNLRVTGDALPDTLQTNKIKVPTSSGGSTYGVGSAGQMLTSNGTTAYWSTPTTGTVTSVKVGSTSYSPTSGVVSLPAYPSVPITSIKMNDATISPSSGVVDLGTVANEGQYGFNMNSRILSRGNVFLAVRTENPEQHMGTASYFYNGIVPMRLSDVDELIENIPTGVTWSNFAYFRIMNMSVISAEVTWTSDVASTSMVLGYIKEYHNSSIYSNSQYTDWPMKRTVTSCLRDNGNGASRDSARIIISDFDGSITVAVAGSAGTAYSNFSRVQFSVSYVNRQTYGPDDQEWWNEPPVY